MQHVDITNASVLQSLVRDVGDVLSRHGQVASIICRGDPEYRLEVCYRPNERGCLPSGRQAADAAVLDLCRRASHDVVDPTTGEALVSAVNSFQFWSEAHALVSENRLNHVWRNSRNKLAMIQQSIATKKKHVKELKSDIAQFEKLESGEPVRQVCCAHTLCRIGARFVLRNCVIVHSALHCA